MIEQSPAWESSCLRDHQDGEQRLPREPDSLLGTDPADGVAEAGGFSGDRGGFLHGEK
jgi:hypothetical protein